MKCNFIQIKLKDKYNNNLSNNKILELLKNLSEKLKLTAKFVSTNQY